MTRRAFMLGLFACICGCARNVPPPPDPDRDFREWLKKRKRWKLYRNREDAEKAWREDVERERKERDWKEWKRKNGLAG